MGSCCGKPIPAADGEAYHLDRLKSASTILVEQLVLEMLSLIASFVNNDQESPSSLVQLHGIAETEEGWIQVVTAAINVIPLDDPFGPSAITILLDDCPLPSKDSVIQMTQQLGLSAERGIFKKVEAKIDRNTCIVLGCIAEKLAGPNSVAILTEDTLNYLIALLSKRDACVVLFAMIALEKFAHTTENRLTIKTRLQNEREHPLLVLENHEDSHDFLWRQVGFCAKWSLDNIFVVPGRRLSYERLNMANINAILNTRDVSEYLKISANGLEARCDSYSFESVRCTFPIEEGTWYYETVIITTGVMQIGWATKNSHFMNHEGYGIGDDLFSLSYDGCRRLIWYKATPTSVPEVRPWRPGDVLGCLIDLEKEEVIFSLNGTRVTPRREIFESTSFSSDLRCGFYAAASFMAFQQCYFNFGHEPFRYPPNDRPFKTFNSYGRLTDEQKKVIPRRLVLAQMQNAVANENSCTLCYDEEGTCILDPCGHRGFCSVCTAQLKECPLCRAAIVNVRLDVT